MGIHQMYGSNIGRNVCYYVYLGDNRQCLLQSDACLNKGNTDYRGTETSLQQKRYQLVLDNSDEMMYEIRHL